MELTIRGKNVKVSDDRRQLIEKKLGKLNHYLEHIHEATVELSAENSRRQTERLVVEMTVRTNGTLLRAEERDSDLGNALDRLHAKMQRQMTRYKGRVLDRKRRKPLLADQAVILTNTTYPNEVTSNEVDNIEDYRPVRVKKFAVRPMPSDEAIEQMELLGHDFFVYLDSASKEIQVVYRRDDGAYGLLQPEIAS